MSFVLPGNSRQLRFTGDAQGFKDDPSGAKSNVALGKPRVRRNTAPPPAAQPETQPSAQAPSPSMRSGRANTNTNTPASPLNTPIPSRGSYTPAPSIRERRHDSDGLDVDDQQATMAIDREGLDLMPGGGPNARPSARPSNAPIPHFRPANAAAQTVLVPGAQQDQKKGAPLALWLFAAVLAGVLSYFVTPMAMSHFETPPAKVSDVR